ncbi:hypothetical protein HYPSUDRAFT_208990 [Hypholoma sublateritium FD-334 SS-4]|uniref:Uncharacterized protein n=1 Tax=Hypholoma sublateritium (strain FD-334 SS-4) TaxID=945553 RepID=A0A0D2LTI0_HYPSF|nr:hypothetical protein HYPSUDRAFT_208990 [Hypholoma sublateritium FD-334 SS-4]
MSGFTTTSGVGTSTGTTVIADTSLAFDVGSTVASSPHTASALTGNGSATSSGTTSIPTGDGSLTSSGSGTETQTSTSAVVSPTIFGASTISPSSDAPATPTAGSSHKPSNSPKGAVAGGVCGGVLLLALLAFFLLRRRRRRRSERPQIPPELAPAPFIRTPSENGLYPADRSAAVVVRADPLQANGVQHKTWRGKFARRGAFQPAGAPTNSQSTNEKRTARAVPTGEVNAAQDSHSIAKSRANYAIQDLGARRGFSIPQTQKGMQAAGKSVYARLYQIVMHHTGVRINRGRG